MRSSRAGTWFVAAAALMLAGCGSDGTTEPEPEDPGLVDGIQTNQTDPAAVPATWAQALEEGSLEAVTRLLSPDFEYFIRDDDADQFPWLPPGTGWTHDVEMNILGNMMDPDFISPETQNPVLEIHMQLDVTSSQDLGDGAIELTTNMDAVVVWAAGTGASTNGRLTIVLVPDDKGFYRIRSQRELPPFSRLLRVESDSWGGIKSLYRSPS